MVYCNESGTKGAYTFTPRASPKYYDRGQVSCWVYVFSEPEREATVTDVRDAFERYDVLVPVGVLSTDVCLGTSCVATVTPGVPS